MSGGAVELVGVSKTFGTTLALDDVDLRVEPGDFFSLLGPSGCGKTTLLRILAGLEQPDVGMVRLDGEDITRMAPDRRPFNIVFQRYALFPHLDVYDNVAFPLSTRRTRSTGAERRRRVEETLRLVGLEGFGGRLPSQLSGGQAQRVAVARALISKPRMVLLDEPLSALDRNVRHAMREELLRIHSELGTTFLLVTHDQDEALSMSDRVALMNAGRIVQLDDARTLYRNPRSLFAARFIGAGTVVEADVQKRENGRVSVQFAGREVRAIDAGTGAATRVKLLLRPEEIMLQPADQRGPGGHVETSAFFGAYHEVTVRIGPDLVRTRASRFYSNGEPVTLGWEPDVGIAYPPEDIAASAT